VSLKYYRIRYDVYMKICPVVKFYDQFDNVLLESAAAERSYVTVLNDFSLLFAVNKI
jgi:hypothetical protein